MADILEHFAAARPGRGEEPCSCCRATGEHEDRSECDRCDGSGAMHRGDDAALPWCPGREDDQPAPQRRHWRQGARRDPFHGEGPWYHGSPEELEPGAVIQPGDVVGKQHMGRGSDSTRAWVTNDAWKASSYGTNIYEVDPSVPPKSMYARHHEHYLPEGGTATVLRKVPYQEATELSPEYQRGKRAMEKQIRQQRRQQHEAGVEDYGIGHRPMEHGAPIHDLAGDAPDADFDQTSYLPGDYLTHRQYHTDSPTEGARDDAEAIAQMRKVRGKPDTPVRIYRATHHSAPHEINTGDWVTLSRTYALKHAYAESGSDDPDAQYAVHHALVPAKHVRDAGMGGYREQGYWGPPIACCGHQKRAAAVTLRMYAWSPGGVHIAVDMYHGSDNPVPFERFDFSKRSLRHQDDEEYARSIGEEAPESRWWNSRLGSHFTSEHSMAAEAARSHGDGHVYHVDVRLEHPKDYASEHDLAREGFEWARHHGYKGLISYRDNVEADQLQQHPQSQQIAEGFRRHLQRQGHDGITYGNEYEQPIGHKCAIIFHPDQAHITDVHGAYDHCAEAGTAHEAVLAEHPEYTPKEEYDGEASKADPGYFDAYRDRKRAWHSKIRRGLSLGHLSHDDALSLGWHPSGHDQREEYSERRTGWQPMPHEMYHVTTDEPGVRAHGLKTREELAQHHGGHGLGGGEDDSISFTTSHELARHILGSLHEYHGFLNHGDPKDLWEAAKRGEGASRPFHEGIASYWHSGWKDGDEIPMGLSAVLRGKETKNTMGRPEHEMAAQGWHPSPHPRNASWDAPAGRIHTDYERDSTPAEAMEHRSEMYKRFSAFREFAGGKPDPMFFSTDVSRFAAKDPRHFALLHAHPRPGAQGYPVHAMSEWRTGSGDAVEVHHAEHLGGITHEASLLAHFGATDWDDHYARIPGEIHRGLYAPQSHQVFSAPMSDEDVAHGLIRAHQEEHFPYDRDQHEKFGTHWSSSEDVARGFAKEHEESHHEDDQCEDHDEHFEATPVVFHARRPERHEIETDERRLGWQNVDDYHGPEQEVTIRHGAPVRITGVSWLKHTGLGPMWHRHDLREPVELRAEDRDSPSDPNQWNASLKVQATDPAEYRMQHEGPDPGEGEGLHEIGSGKIWPKDFHQRPGDYHLGADWESIDKVHRSKDWPSRKVWAYRALPSPYREINPGDWVSTSSRYARSEGRTSTNSDDDYPVVKFQARAEHLRNEGNSLDEWSYQGPKVNRALVHFSGGKNHRGKGPRGGTTDAMCYQHEPEEMYSRYEAQNRERREKRRAERERTAAAIPRAERTESVRHMLDHYAPTDFDTWAQVRDNIVWDHPTVRAFTEDVRQNGVRRPIPVDYHSDPPRVMNGHTRLLAAEKAGLSEVPTRQHEGWMDPDDPDAYGRGPDDPDHWTNKDEWNQHEAGQRGDLPELEYYHVLQGRERGGYHAVVAAHEGQVVGHLSWGPNSAKIQQLWVHPQYRRQGVADAIHARARWVEPGLEHHVDRTPAGDAWAHSVSEDVPERLNDTGSHEDTERKGAWAARQFQERLDSGHRTMKRLAVLPMPGYQNPHTQGDEWFHGTQASHEELGKGFYHPADVAAGAYEMPESEEGGHWNALLGTHFTADHDIAEEFARGEHSSGANERHGWDDEEAPEGVVHARLGLKNPKHYDSEHDMDHEAYEHEHAAGNHPSDHVPGIGKPGDADEDDDDELYEAEEMWPNAHRIAKDYGHDKIPASTYGHMHGPFAGHPMRTAWLNTHPDKWGIADRFQKRLREQGHDGITYGNEYEKSRYGRLGNRSAIVFDPGQIHITRHHLAGEEHEPELPPHEGARPRRKPLQPDQEECWKCGVRAGKSEFTRASPYAPVMGLAMECADADACRQRREENAHTGRKEGFDWSGLTHGRYDVPTGAVHALRQHEQRSSGKYPDLPGEVAERGIEQPLEVSLHDDGRVVLRGGSHRVNIARDLGHPTVPVQVVDMRTRRLAVSAGAKHYHGTTRWYQEGDLIRSPADRGSPHDTQHEESDPSKVYSSDDPQVAGDFALLSRGMPDQARVYEVRHTGPVESDPHPRHINSFQSTHPMRVVRQLDKSEWTRGPETWRSGDKLGDWLKPSWWEGREAGKKGPLPEDLQFHFHPGEEDDKGYYRMIAHVPGDPGEHPHPMLPPDRLQVGFVNWMHHDYKKQNPVDLVWTHPDWYRRGIATATWEQAAKADPTLVHAGPAATRPAGKKWKKSLPEHLSVFVPSERIFGPTYGLDRRLFGDDEKLRPAVRDELMSRLGGVLGNALGPDWHLVVTAWLAGSQASRWTSPELTGNGDLDVLIGVSFSHARQANPGLARLTDEELEHRLNGILRERFSHDGWHPPFDPDGSYDLTGYVIHTADIRDIKPYAAYNLSDDSWTVEPPDLPDWSAEQFPQGPALMQQARALIAEVRAILRLPDPFRHQEAERIWRYIHEGRAQSFGPGGLGWQGTGNVLEKALDQASGQLVGKLKQVIYGPADDHPVARAQGMTTASPEVARA